MSNNKNQDQKDTQFPPINPEDLFEVLDHNDLAWDVYREPVLRMVDGEVLEVPKEYNLFKGASGTDKFMSVGPDYTILQNSEFVELALQVANFFGVKDIPTFKQYTKTYSKKKIEGGVIRANIPIWNIEPKSVKNRGDVVSVSVTLTNSHDGSHGLQWGLYTRVLSCSNGLTMNQQKYRKSVRHLSNMQTMLQNSIVAFEQLREAAKGLESDIDRLSTSPVTQEQIKEIIHICAGVTKEEQKDPKKISTRKQNIIQKVADSITHEIKEKGASKWGLLNGATLFSRDSDSSEYTKEYGILSKKANKVYDYLIKESKNKNTKGAVVDDVIIDDFQMALNN